MKITVIGAGYVGLVAAVCFAQGGHQVICLERDEQRCRTLENGQCPILEEGLPPKLDSALSKGYLQFTTDSETAIPWGSSSSSQWAPRKERMGNRIYVRCNQSFRQSGSMDATGKS